MTLTVTTLLAPLHRHWLYRSLARLRRAPRLHRERLALAHLDPHLLRDIGVSRDEAQAEAARTCWDGPDHWRR